MADKKELKKKIFKKLEKIIDGIEIIGDINFFKITVKCTNGKLTYEQSNTYQDG